MPVLSLPPNTTPPGRSAWPTRAGALLPLALVALALLLPGVPRAAQPADEVILKARDALRDRHRGRLAAARQAAAGHPLAMWVDYWELGNRLDQAQQPELDAFYARWPRSYVEDRLRNDWLLELGKRRDWANFRAEFPRFRMNDDREVSCFHLLTRHLDGHDVAEPARRAWAAARSEDDGCLLLGRTLAEAGVFKPEDLYTQLRAAAEGHRPRQARAIAALLQPRADQEVAALFDNPARYLARHGPVGSTRSGELVLLALTRLAAGDPEAAAAQIEAPWGPRLLPEQRATAWAQAARFAALKLQPQAAAYARRAWREWDGAGAPIGQPAWSDELLAWQVRAALREGEAGGAQRWRLVQRATAAMSEAERGDAAWVYWRARALQALAAPGAAGEPDREAARRALAGLAEGAGALGFYGQLAAEDLGQRVALPAPPAPVTAAERDAVRAHPGLARGLRLIELGLRSEGVREWNFTLRDLAGERELIAAAQWACEREVWDRCINTSERSRTLLDLAQRYPTPFADAVRAAAQQSGLDPALVFGLIRQESRFIADIRSHAGANGLMQLMPATAAWTAKKIGLEGWRPGRVNEPEVNLALGTAYLRRVLDDLDGSPAMAAAAYNAGPGRPRRWREGVLLEPAAWAEAIPFNETRDYVKKVLANAVVYAHRLGTGGTALKARLGAPVGPRAPGAPEGDKDIP